MPRLSHKGILKVSSMRVKRMINDRRFQRRLAEIKTIRVNRRFDIPYVAGYSETGNTIFIDRHLSTLMEKRDIQYLLVTHEVTEKALLDIFHLDYQQAHHIATNIEHEIALKSGVNWERYLKFLDPQMKTIGSDKVKVVPKDLDIEPYQDEKDFDLLKRMKLHAR